VQEIVDGTEAIAAVDGAFSLKYLNSNVMIGPVLSQIAGIAGKFYNNSENRKLARRPLVLIGSCSQVHCLRSHKHNLSGVG